MSGFPAEAVSSVNSTAENPMRATPSRTPMVAGTPPWNLTTDSRCVAKAVLSGYGKPVRASKISLIVDSH